MKRKSILTLAVATLAALSISACGSAASNAGGAPGSNGASVTDPGEKGFDISNIQTDPEIAKLVPEAIKAKGVLSSASSTDYAPAEYRKQSDNQTPTGYGVDMVRAMAKVMGLKAKTTHAEFDSIISQVGTKYDIGVSSFTITPERLAQMNMVSYSKVGFAFGVKKGNPKKFSPQDLCGHIIGAQTGTAQLEWLEKKSEECKAAGKKPIDIKPHKDQTEATQKVVGGQYDATVADYPIIGYASRMTNGQLEKAGEAFDTALHGVVISKDNEQLTKAVEAALNKLIKDGIMKKLFDYYGVGEIFIDKAEINPKVS